MVTFSFQLNPVWVLYVRIAWSFASPSLRSPSLEVSKNHKLDSRSTKECGSHWDFHMEEDAPSIASYCCMGLLLTAGPEWSGKSCWKLRYHVRAPLRELNLLSQCLSFQECPLLHWGSQAHSSWFSAIPFCLKISPKALGSWALASI